MNKTIPQLISDLEREFPDYHCWIVHTAVPPSHWNARRWDESDGPINCTSYEELRARLEKEDVQ